MTLIKIFGLFLCFGFVAFFWRLSSVASAMTDFCDSVPVGEDWEEEEFSSDDDYYFRATENGVEVGALARED